MPKRICLCLFLLAASTPLFSQFAELSGYVKDPTGASIVKATVELRNQDTGIRQQATTNQVGIYRIPAIKPGTYVATVQAQGFKTLTQDGVILNVDERASLDFDLQVGAVSEAVNVSGGTPVVNTESATVGTVVDRQTLENIPLNGRSFQGLITLTPGVGYVVPGNNTPGQFVVNGQRTDTSYFTVDGVSANVAASVATNVSANGTGSAVTNSVTGGYNNLVSIDAVQEFRVSTSSFAPEFGRTPGGQVSIVSRGGTNAFHGAIFEYFRNTVLDANDWFLNATGKPRGVVHENDFGGVIGGPIVKSKLFFFASYEGLRLQAPTPSVKLVPTQAARTLAAAANSGGVVGYMAQFLNAYPLPDGNPTTPCTSYATCLANATLSFPGKTGLDAISGRVDYIMNNRMNFFGRISRAPQSMSNDNSVTTTAFDNSNDVYTAGWAVVISNSMSNDARFNFTRTTSAKNVAPIKGRYAGDLTTIFPSGYAQPPESFANTGTKVAPGMAVQLGGFGTDTFLIAPHQTNNSQEQVNIVDNFGWVKGAHQLKFGTDIRVLSPTLDVAHFNWNNQFAQRISVVTPNALNVCPTSVLPAGSGTTVPGFICGQATLSNLQRTYASGQRVRQHSFFAQDTWKTSRRLTMTYGVRWEINPSARSTSHTPGFSINPSTFSLSDVSKIQLNPWGSPYYPTRWGNVAPRFGLAYQLSTSPTWGLVLRAGYGIFYDTGNQTGSLIVGPWGTRFNNTGAGTTAALVQFPITSADSQYVTPTNASLTLPLSSGGTDSFIDPTFRMPYVHQMNLTLEQQLGEQQSFTVSYIGALGKRLIGPAFYPAGRANPNVFKLATNTLSDALQIFGNYSSSNYHALQTKFQRQFSKTWGAIASYTWAHSIDDASTNYLFNAYLPTAPQLASNLPITLLRGSSDFDIRHNIAFSVVYNTPNPRNEIARAILGRWSIAPIYHYQTAIPIDMFTGSTGALGGTIYFQRPNLIPGVPVYVSGDTCSAQYTSLQGYSGCPGGKALNIAPVTAAVAASAGCITTGLTGKTATAKGAFCTPAPVNGQQVSGNVGRNFLRGLPLQELDLSINRDFPIRNEKVKLRFQADMFNVFNHPTFGPLGASVNNAAFGITTSMLNSSIGAAAASGWGFNSVFATGGPRNFQFSLKLSF